MTKVRMKIFLGLGSLLLAFALSWASAKDSHSVQFPRTSKPLPAEEVIKEAEVKTAVAPPSGPTWSAPNYSDQLHAAAWSKSAFAVPKGMEARVQFWKDIYTKYTSDQGVLHDSLIVSLVYGTIDFTDIMLRTDLSPRDKERARRDRLTEKKQEIQVRLLRLQETTDPSSLQGEDRRLWEMFEKVDGANKFIEASQKGRLRFQLGQRSQFAEGIRQSGRYLRQMEEIFRQEGMPIELTRLPFVESSFNLNARSKVGASGVWQFMRGSARPYMRMDSSADERNDPLRATRSAAKKLRTNYQMLKLWPLAVTGYNHGPSGVLRLTQNVGTTDIVELLDVRRGRFGFASANFYASFLAALEVEREADKYFGLIEVLPELRGAEIQLLKSQNAKVLLKYFDGDLTMAKQFNPHITAAVWSGRIPLSPKHILRVPFVIEAQARNDLN